MEGTTNSHSHNLHESNTNRRLNELQAFDNTQLGVKGLVESGISNLPMIFTTNTTHDHPSSDHDPKLDIPTIDLEGIHSDETRRKGVLEEMKRACREWGLFQVVNHGIPASILDEMLAGVRRFHEEDDEVKKAYYSRDESKKFKYFSNFVLYTGKVADWSDSFSCVMAPDPPRPEDLPEACRDVLVEYTDQVKKLGIDLLELFSEALGLKSNHLKEMDCAEGMYVKGHYYPVCPEPDRAIGFTGHCDNSFFTVLLQDDTGGLQLLHDNRWVDAHPFPGSLIIIVGDMLQLITNDKFKSGFHRVLAQGVCPRISMACFFRTHFQATEKSRLYRPIKELVSEDNPLIYRETSITEYVGFVYDKGLNGTSSALPHFKL